MKVKTSEATGVVLDWLVVEAHGYPTAELIIYEGNGRKWLMTDGGFTIDYSNWAQGGPIKEREGIATRRDSKGVWYAMLSTDLGDGEGARWIKYTYRSVPNAKTTSVSRACRFTGNTELVAAMRCYVASKLGDEVEVPDELA